MECYYSVLVAEDDPKYKAIYELFCKELGFIAFIVSSYAEATTALQTYIDCFDIIVLNEKFLDGDNIECRKQVREFDIKTGTHIPIIITSNSIEFSYSDRRKKLGVDDYLSNVFTFEEFRKILLRWAYNPQRPNLKLLPAYTSSKA